MKKIKKAIIAVAGSGTRLLPATKAQPKEMLPIVDKPIIQLVVEELVEAGIEDIIFVTRWDKKPLEDHFDHSLALEYDLKKNGKDELRQEIYDLAEMANFIYIRQKGPYGNGTPVLNAQNIIGNEAFAVVLADDLCNHSCDGLLKQMVEIYDQYRCSVVAIEEVPMDQTNKYGIIAGERVDSRDDLYRVTDMVEKPDPKDAPTNMAIIGRYILTPDIFDILRKTDPGKGGEIQITDALLEQAKEGKVIAYKFKGKRFDCGSVDGFVEATNYFYEKL